MLRKVNFTEKVKDEIFLNDAAINSWKFIKDSAVFIFKLEKFM